MILYLFGTLYICSLHSMNAANISYHKYNVLRYLLKTVITDNFHKDNYFSLLAAGIIMSPSKLLLDVW